MTLDREDIEALAKALAPLVAAEMRAREEVSLDSQYLASLPVHEMKKIQRAKMRQFKAEQKSKRAA